MRSPDVIIDMQSYIAGAQRYSAGLTEREEESFAKIVTRAFHREYEYLCSSLLAMLLLGVVGRRQVYMAAEATQNIEHASATWEIGSASVSDCRVFKLLNIACPPPLSGC